MNHDDIKSLMKDIAPVIRQYVKEALDNFIAAIGDAIGRRMQEDLAPLEKRVAKIEQKGLLSYRGTFQRADDYQRGDCITHSGSLWVALKASRNELPGKEPAAWQLISKGTR